MREILIRTDTRFAPPLAGGATGRGRARQRTRESGFPLAIEARSTTRQSSGWRRAHARVAILLLFYLAAQLWLPASAAAAGSPTLGGPFQLVDQNGAPRTDADFHGSYPLIFFGFTHCPDLCPTSLTTMSQALDKLAERAPGKAARVVPIFITVDPERDTVAAMKEYVKAFHPRLVGLTGTPDQIDQVARNYGAYYAPVPIGGGDYLMDHSGFILLMGAAGEYITHFESGVTADELVGELEKRVKD